MLIAEEVTTDDGVLIRKTARSLVPSWDDSYRAGNLVEHVQKAIDAFPGHDFAGHRECEGEVNTDIWRVVVRDGRAARVEAKVSWPGDEGYEAAAARTALGKLRRVAEFARDRVHRMDPALVLEILDRVEGVR